MRRVLFAGAILALVSAPLAAQNAGDAPRPDSSGHWEIGLYPTVRKLTYDLAAKHEWGGGGTIGLGYRFSRVVSLNAEFLGAWIPQLNTVTQGQANELLPTLALQLQIPGERFRPYVVLGGGHESFHFEAPVVPGHAQSEVLDWPRGRRLPAQARQLGGAAHGRECADQRASPVVGRVQRRVVLSGRAQVGADGRRRAASRHARHGDGAHGRYARARRHDEDRRRTRRRR